MYPRERDAEPVVTAERYIGRLDCGTVAERVNTRVRTTASGDIAAQTECPRECLGQFALNGRHSGLILISAVSGAVILNSNEQFHTEPPIKSERYSVSGCVSVENDHSRTDQHNGTSAYIVARVGMQRIHARSPLAARIAAAFHCSCEIVRTPE